jgi:hypothetical protein
VVLEAAVEVAIIVNLRGVVIPLYAATRIRSDSVLNPKYKKVWTCDEDRMRGVTRFGP